MWSHKQLLVAAATADLLKLLHIPRAHAAVLDMPVHFKGFEGSCCS
jgi:hypothetical protein